MAIVPADDMASGMFATKTPTTKASRVLKVEVFTRMPMTRLSGTLSMRMPSQIMMAACAPREDPWPSWSPCEEPLSESCLLSLRALALAMRSGRSCSSSPRRMPVPTSSSTFAYFGALCPGLASCAATSLASLASAAPPGEACAAPACGGSLSCACVLRCQPRSSSCETPNFSGAMQPSGGCETRAARSACGSARIELAIRACRRRSSRSQSLSMSSRWTIRTVVGSSATAVARAFDPYMRCSVPSSPLGPTTCFVSPPLPSSAAAPPNSRSRRVTSTRPRTTKWMAQCARKSSRSTSPARNSACRMKDTSLATVLGEQRPKTSVSRRRSDADIATKSCSRRLDARRRCSAGEGIFRTQAGVRAFACAWSVPPVNIDISPKMLFAPMWKQSTTSSSSSGLASFAMPSPSYFVVTASSMSPDMTK
mmetsp:Transcript_40851/g.121097  ORF Transcript_40851/g.121097 Transcript_40851/m.121097 type:complete len:424 (+) Transcript_40851:249-1520(+)